MGRPDVFCADLPISAAYSSVAVLAVPDGSVARYQTNSSTPNSSAVSSAARPPSESFTALIVTGATRRRAAPREWPGLRAGSARREAGAVAHQVAASLLMGKPLA